MKIFNCPKEVPAPKPDYSSRYNRAAEIRAEDKHKTDLMEWLQRAGYTGKQTGKVYRDQVADGYALYMVADGPKSCLIHLPYGDAYHSRDASFLPKKEIIRRIEARRDFVNRFNH
jgi:hypothetical protein